MEYSINYKQEILGSIPERPGTPSSLIDDLINIKATLEQNVQNSPEVRYERQSVRGQVILQKDCLLDYVSYSITIQKENKIRVNFQVGHRCQARTFKRKDLALIAIQQFESSHRLP
jgi:hypothetical protein